MENQKIQKVSTSENTNDKTTDKMIDSLDNVKDLSNSLIEECRKHMDTLNTKMNDVKSLVDNPNLYIYNYFEEIRRQVDWRRETLKKELDDSSDRVIAQVEQAKSDCMKINVSKEEKKDKIEGIEKGLQTLRNKLDTLSVDKARIDELGHELYLNKKKLDEMLIEYQDEVRGNKEYLFEYFEYGPDLMNNYNFGEFRTEILPVKSMMSFLLQN